MVKRSPKTAPAAEPEVAEEAAAPKAAPKRRRAKAATPAASEPEAEPAGEIAAAPADDAFAGLPPEIAAMLAAAAAAAPAEDEADAAALPDGAEAFGLPPVLDLTAASALREGLLAKRGTPLVLDGSSVERLGGQCLQILLSARATWAADGQALALSDPSEALLRDLTILGVAAETLSTTHEPA